MSERYPKAVKRAVPAAAVGLLLLAGCGEQSDDKHSTDTSTSVSASPSKELPTGSIITGNPTPPKELPSDAATSSMQIVCEGVFTYKNFDGNSSATDDTYNVVARPVVLNNAEMGTVGVINEIGRYGVSFAELPLDEAGGPAQWYDLKGEPKMFGEINCTPQEVSARKIGNTYVATTQPNGPDAAHIDAKALNPAATGMADWHIDERLSYASLGNVLDSIAKFSS